MTTTAAHLAIRAVNAALDAAARKRHAKPTAIYAYLSKDELTMWQTYVELGPLEDPVTNGGGTTLLVKILAAIERFDIDVEKLLWPTELAAWRHFVRARKPWTVHVPGPDGTLMPINLVELQRAIGVIDRELGPFNASSAWRTLVDARLVLPAETKAP